MNFPKNNFFPLLLIIIVSALILLPFLGAMQLFDWDEINFAESAREMIATGNYARVQIDYQPFWEKPPLFFWLQALSMQLFGINEFAARFPNAIIGIVTAITFFLIGKKFYDTRFGILWAASILTSFLPLFYFRSGIIDPVFNYFIFLGVYFMMRVIANENRSELSHAFLWGIFIGLAILTKGPVALLIVLLVLIVYWITTRFRKIISLKQLVIFFLSLTIVSAVWVLPEVIAHGLGILQQFILYQIELLTNPVAGHGGPLYYHFVIVFAGCFPMSVIALPSLIKNYREETPLDIKCWMLTLFWVVMILFTIVKTKIVHYSSLTYFPLSFLSAFTIQKYFASRSFPRWMLVILIFMGSVFSLLLTAVPWLIQHKEFLVPYLKDPFAVDTLSTTVNWSGAEQFIGAGYFLLVFTAVILLWKRRMTQGIIVLFSATTICLLLYQTTVAPKILAYSQGPAVQFYKELKGQHVFVTTVGFKSYAQLFYFSKPPEDSSLNKDQQWLLTGDIDRPAYFVTKTSSMNLMQQYPDVHLLKKEGGFAFYLRGPINKH